MRLDNQKKQNYLLDLIRSNGINVTDDMIKEIMIPIIDDYEEEEEDSGKWIDDYKDEFDEDDAMRENNNADI